MDRRPPRPDPAPPATGTARPHGRHGRGLVFKVFAITFPVAAVIVALTQITVGWLTYSERLETFSERGRLLAQTTAQSIGLPVWNMDRTVYQAQIAGLAQETDIRQVLLLDEAGAVLAGLGQPPAAGDESLVFTAPVTGPAGVGELGRVEVIMSTAALRASALRQLWIGLGALAVLMAGFSLALHTAVRRLVQRPLTLLLGAMGAVERKQWTRVPPAAAGRDEIGDVIRAFNGMVDGLESGDEAKRLLTDLRAAQGALVAKNAELARANDLILEGIRYARRIQRAMLPDITAFRRAPFADIAGVWEPLHEVGGDYYWMETVDGRTVIIVVDCTGHGVPGAFITLVTAMVLERILAERPLPGPAAILERLDDAVRARLRQDRQDAESDDGLEALVFVYDHATGTATFAGAGLSLVIDDTAVAGAGAGAAENEVVREIRGRRTVLGYSSLAARLPVPEHAVAVVPGRVFHLFTDGFTDQMGEQTGRLLGRRGLRRMLQRAEGATLDARLEVVRADLRAWRGPQSLRDDMTMISVMPLGPDGATGA